MSGTKWFPGENVGIGKDHTIYATEYGYVRYYKDPLKHPKRRYIGVALQKEGTGSELPTPTNAITRRRLGMYATKIKEPDVDFLQQHLSTSSVGDKSASKEMVNPPRPTTMRQRTLMYRESNYEIGRSAEKKGITVRPFDRSDRWMAWRKRSAKIKRKLLERAAKKKTGRKGKAKNVAKKIAQAVSS